MLRVDQIKFVAMELTRAFAFIASRGREGASPHVLSDLIVKLSRRGHEVRIHRANSAPLEAMMSVNGTTFHLWANDIVVTVQSPFASVTVNPHRIVHVPVEDALRHQAMNWMSWWPAANEEECAFLKRMTMDKTTGFSVESYVSEEVLADAIETVLNTTPGE